MKYTMSKDGKMRADMILRVRLTRQDWDMYRNEFKMLKKSGHIDIKDLRAYLNEELWSALNNLGVMVDEIEKEQ